MARKSIKFYEPTKVKKTKTKESIQGEPWNPQGPLDVEPESIFDSCECGFVKYNYERVCPTCRRNSVN